MLYKLIRSFLFQLDPETAHGLIMGNLDWAAACKLVRLVCPAPERYPVRVMGLDFPNAVGLAAGMDKNAAHVKALGELGFGHIEVGTLTPRAQGGNPRPRLWRLIPAQGIVNYMGFNNCGADEGIANLQRSVGDFRTKGGIVGINLGKQTATPVEKALPDYRELMQKLYAHADYLAIDISCPNTPGLTCLQQTDAIAPLLAGIADERKKLADQQGRYVPITVKIGPDLGDDVLRQIGDLLVKYGMDAVTATNTTIQRKGVEHLENSRHRGGLSGRPLFARSTEVVRIFHEHLQGTLPIIAVGGIMTADDAVSKMQAGASLVQLYTGFIYTGPALITDCARAIAAWRMRHPAQDALPGTGPAA